MDKQAHTSFDPQSTFLRWQQSVYVIQMSSYAANIREYYTPPMMTSEELYRYAVATRHTTQVTIQDTLVLNAGQMKNDT